MQDDSVWKEVLERYFEDFFKFFFPRISRDIDWSQKPVFLDKELQAVLRADPRGRQYVDKLARVRLRSGKDSWILLHVEVEGRAGPGFTRRMLFYNHRIFERYGEKVVSLALLTHAGSRHHQKPFHFRRWGFRYLFQFPLVRLSSYRGRERSLERSRNPFALLTLAHLKRQEAGRDAGAKLSVKQDLVRMLYERGYGRDDIMQLARFVDWLVRLPQALEDQFDDWAENYERSKSMPYVTSFERRGIRIGKQEGLKKGRAEGLHEAIQAVLERRFGKKGARLLSRVELPVDRGILRRLFREVLDAEDLDAAARSIEKRCAKTE